MSDPVSNAEIEDVLSSIRRLVSDDPKGVKARKADLRAAKDKLVLTPALRVSDKAAGWQPDTEDNPDLSEIAELSMRGQPSDTAEGNIGESSLQDRAEGIEAVLTQTDGNWEPDGSETPDSDETRPLSADANFDMAKAWERDMATLDGPVAIGSRTEPEPETRLLNEPETTDGEPNAGSSHPDGETGSGAPAATDTQDDSESKPETLQSEAVADVSEPGAARAPDPPKVLPLRPEPRASFAAMPMAVDLSAVNALIAEFGPVIPRDSNPTADTDASAEPLHQGAAPTNDNASDPAAGPQIEASDGPRAGMDADDSQPTQTGSPDAGEADETAERPTASKDGPDAGDDADAGRHAEDPDPALVTPRDEADIETGTSESISITPPTAENEDNPATDRDPVPDVAETIAPIEVAADQENVTQLAPDDTDVSDNTAGFADETEDANISTKSESVGAVASAGASDDMEGPEIEQEAHDARPEATSDALPQDASAEDAQPDDAMAAAAEIVEADDLSEPSEAWSEPDDHETTDPHDPTVWVVDGSDPETGLAGPEDGRDDALPGIEAAEPAAETDEAQAAREFDGADDRAEDADVAAPDADIADVSELGADIGEASSLHTDLDRGDTGEASDADRSADARNDAAIAAVHQVDPESDTPSETEPAAETDPVGVVFARHGPERDPDATDAAQPDGWRSRRAHAKPEAYEWEDIAEADIPDLADAILDEDALRDLVAEIVRDELRGALGEKLTRSIRRFVRREIQLALAAQELDG